MSLTEALISAQSEVLSRNLHRLVAEGKVPGIGAVIVIGEKRIAAFAGQEDFGTGIALSATSSFETSCLMKFLVSLAIWRLIGHGKLDLNTPLGELFPDLKALAPERAAKVQVKHLLSHTAGYRGLDISRPEVRWQQNWPKFLNHFHSAPQSFPPGMVFNYEHSEHVLLGKIIEHVTGISAQDFVFENFLDPLKISSNANPPSTTGYARQGAAEFLALRRASPGSFWNSSLSPRGITLDDVAHIGRAVSSTFFSRAYIPSLLMAPFVSFPKTYGSSPVEYMPASFGLSCAQYGPDVIGHNFSTAGQSCSLRILPLQDVAIAVGINCWAPEVRDAVTEWILGAFISREVQRAINKKIDASALFGEFQPDQLCGTYLGSYESQILVEWDNDELRAFVPSRGGKNTIFSVRLGADGFAEIEHKRPVATGFFGSPDDISKPCLMIGLNAYKRF
jgi:CubicO group peptidase (beta-lactamase class C family)